MAEITTIQLETKTKEKLKIMGRKGETYNDIILRLVDLAEYESFMKKQYQILDEETEWVPLEELE
ncbi:MAG: hypothetical protein JSV43_08960 [Methanobacteriota archaeon]|nr:MAG: hypothetical protein JSV43_08960 [Euryarchaeota archaeon]